MGMLVQWDVTKAAWTSRTDQSVNPLASDEYTSIIDPQGRLVVLNKVSKDYQGGLISTNIPFPNFFKPTYFGLDVYWRETAEDLPYKPRNEMDLKVTVPGGAQANGSCQWNKTANCWDLDPTGKAWVHTAFNQGPVVGPNHYTMRLRFDSKAWSIDSLSINSKKWNVDIATFQNIPALASGWGDGLHPQLQTEALAPWFLRTIYTEVLITASDSLIPDYAD